MESRHDEFRSFGGIQMEIRDISTDDLKRGMIVAEDVVANGKMVVDKETMLSGRMIVLIKNKGVERVKIMIRPVTETEGGEAVESAIRVDPVKETIENILLYDPEQDDELKMMRNVMNLWKTKDPRAVEALDYVLNYVPIGRARELASDGLAKLRCQEALPSIMLALNDELPKVRFFAVKYLSREPDKAIAERLFHFMDENTSADTLKDIFGILSSWPPDMVREACQAVIQKGGNFSKTKALEFMAQLKDD